MLAIAASQFITGASRIATALGASPLFIGAVLVGAGTSLPDGLVSGFAAARGDGALALGNVIGSNTLNTTLVLAAAATIAVGLAVLVRRRGWGMAIPLIAVGAVVGWLPIGPSAPPDPGSGMAVIRHEMA